MTSSADHSHTENAMNAETYTPASLWKSNGISELMRYPHIWNRDPAYWMSSWGRWIRQ